MIFEYDTHFTFVWQPCQKWEFNFIRVKRRPPVRPGYWLPLWDVNPSLLVGFTCWWFMFQWSFQLINPTPRGLKTERYGPDQARLYHGKDISEEYRALVKQRQALDDQCRNLVFYGTPEAPPK